MRPYQKFMTSAFLLPLFMGGVLANTPPVVNEVPIPNAHEKMQGQPFATVDVIVVDRLGNMTEEQLPFDPQTQSVVVHSNYGGDNASIFFPLFETGFMYWDGYWVGQNGHFWDGSSYKHVKEVDWHNHWNLYWRHDWEPKWKRFSSKNPKYHNQPSYWISDPGNWDHYTHPKVHGASPNRSSHQ